MEPVPGLRRAGPGGVATKSLELDLRLYMPLLEGRKRGIQASDLADHLACRVTWHWHPVPRKNAQDLLEGTPRHLGSGELNTDGNASCITPALCSEYGSSESLTFESKPWALTIHHLKSISNPHITHFLALLFRI